MKNDIPSSKVTSPAHADNIVRGIRFQPTRNDLKQEIIQFSQESCFEELQQLFATNQRLSSNTDFRYGVFLTYLQGKLRETIEKDEGGFIISDDELEAFDNFRKLILTTRRNTSLPENVIDIIHNAQPALAKIAVHFSNVLSLKEARFAELRDSLRLLPESQAPGPEKNGTISIEKYKNYRKNNLPLYQKAKEGLFDKLEDAHNKAVYYRTLLNGVNAVCDRLPDLIRLADRIERLETPKTR